MSLGTFWGDVMALAVFVGVFAIAVAICRAMLGDVLTALLIVIAAVWGIWAGWQWLIHNDHLALQIVGWAIPFLLVVGIVTAIGLAVDAHRNRTNEADEADEPEVATLRDVE
jgi:hypothetical protein